MYVYAKELMRLSISDIIEEYLKKILHSTEDKMIEIKRSEIADRFQCVPSQINYVINTRFTLEKGYVIESKRGGGGYIRIFRIEHQDNLELLNELTKMINPKVSEQGAIDVLERLVEKKVINEREMKLIRAMVQRETLNLPLPERDIIRSRLLTSVLNTLKYINK